MRCSEAERLIQAELDGAARDHGAAAAHLAACAACREALAAHRQLRQLLAADPPRAVSDRFDTALSARLAAAAPASAPRTWWRRLEFRASWRLRPALAAAAVCCAAAAAWVTLPGGGPRGAYVEQCVAQHQILTRIHPPEASGSEQEIVDFSIAQTTRGSIADTN